MRELMLVFHKDGALYFSVDTSAQGGDLIYWDNEVERWQARGYRVVRVGLNPQSMDGQHRTMV